MKTPATGWARGENFFPLRVAWGAVRPNAALQRGAGGVTASCPGDVQAAAAWGQVRMVTGLSLKGGFFHWTYEPRRTLMGSSSEEGHRRNAAAL